MIIHIAGASGSGKTTLGNKLKTYYGNKIVIKDLDELLWNDYIPMKDKSNISASDFFKNFEEDYQKYIDDFIKENKKMNIIFVGINTFIQGEKQHFKGLDEEFPTVMFDLHADYKYYIDIPIDQIVKQKFNREISHFCDDKDRMFNNLLENQNRTQKNIINNITHQTDIANIKKQTEKWNKFYKEKGYIFLSQDDIYKKIIEIIKINKQDGGYYNKYIKYKIKYLQLCE